MKPMVDTRALMEIKVVRSFDVVAFEMYVMHSVTDPDMMKRMERN